MRFPKLPGRSADEAPAAEAQVAPPQHTGITAVPIPETVPPPLTSELTRSIRFSISEPQGYYFEQVETFVQQVIEVLGFYEQAEYKWQQFAYEMQLEVDQQAHDAQRLRSEIELFKVQGSPLVNADGSYMTESQTSMLDKVSADLNFVKDQLSASEQARLVGQEEINRLQDLAAMRDQEIASLRAWGEQVIVDMQALQAHAAALEAQLVAAQEAAAAAPAQSPAVSPAAPAPAPIVAVESVVAVEPVAVPDPEGDSLDDFDVEVPLVEVDSLEVFEDESYDEPEAHEPVAPAYVEANTPAAPPVVAPIAVEGYPASVPAEAVPAQVVEPVIAPVAVAVADPDADVQPVYEQQYSPDTIPDPQPQAGHAEQGYYNPEADVTVDEPIVEVPVVEVPVAAPDPQAVEAPVAHEDDVYEDKVQAPAAEAAWNIDSELPEGVSLPGTGEAAYSYPAATPGAPLETHGVPVGVWAPELDPRITQALAEEANQQAGPPAP